MGFLAGQEPKEYDVIVMKWAKSLGPINPQKIRELRKTACFNMLKVRYRIQGRPKSQGETLKAKPRRIREGFFEKYCNGSGLDIGFGGDLLTGNCKGWDIEHGDAQYLEKLGDLEFDFVHSSHTLEHMINPEISLRNWWRVLKRGGYLILYVPHRNLYEKKTTLPSRWNTDHKHFFLLDKDEEPCTIGIVPLIKRSISEFEIVYAKECSEGHTITNPQIHSNGEYSIEVVVKKK
jgi:SAM-dependent methyltransferase